MSDKNNSGDEEASTNTEKQTIIDDDCNDILERIKSIPNWKHHLQQSIKKSVREEEMKDPIKHPVASNKKLLIGIAIAGTILLILYICDSFFRDKQPIKQALLAPIIHVCGVVLVYIIFIITTLKKVNVVGKFFILLGLIPTIILMMNGLLNYSVNELAKAEGENPAYYDNAVDIFIGIYTFVASGSFILLYNEYKDLKVKNRKEEEPRE